MGIWMHVLGTCSGASHKIQTGNLPNACQLWNKWNACIIQRSTTSAQGHNINDDPWIHVNEVSQTGYQMVLLHSKFKTGKQMLFKTHIISPLTTQKNMLSLWMRAGHTPICTKCRTHYISIVKDNEISTLTCILCFNQKHLKQAI